MKTMKLLPILLLLALPAVAFGQTTALWTNRYVGPLGGADQAFGVAVDTNGNCYVAGLSADTSGSIYAIIKYSSTGVPIWTNRDVHGYSAPRIVVDSSGYVIVAGESRNPTNSSIYDFLTAKFSNDGVLQWTNTFVSGTANWGSLGLAVDTNGNIFVTGIASSSDIATIKYSGAGSQRWIKRYGPGGGGGAYIAVDTNGDAIVTGNYYSSISLDRAYATIKYSGATGTPVWTNLYSGASGAYKEDTAAAEVVDGSGNVYVTGKSQAGDGHYEYATVKYSKDGATNWVTRFSRFTQPAQPNALAVDVSGNVFVTGKESSWYSTIAYSALGTPLWTNFYYGSISATPTSVAVDGSGNVIVTGYSVGNAGYDYATVKYSGAGTLLWTNQYDGSGNTNDIAMAMAVDISGNAFVTGYSTGTNGYYNYATIKYSGSVPPTGSLLVNLTPAGAVSAGVQWRVDGGVWQTNGVIVSGLSVGSHTVAFSTVSGWITPGDQTATISANATNTVTGTYVAQSRIIGLSGSLAFGSVVTNTTATRTLTITNSGNSTLNVTSISYPAGFSGAWSGTIAANGSQNVTVTFAPTALASYSGTVTVSSDATSGGNTINASGAGTVATGSLQVNLSPAGAVSAGAQWQVDSGAWQNSGAIVSGLSVGSHTVTFNAISGWTTPASQIPTVSANLTNTVTGTYLNFTYSTNNGTITVTGYTGTGSTVNIPSTINGLLVVSIGDSAFLGISSVTSVTIPDSITNIGYHAFYNCTSLTSVTIGTNVITIGSVAFAFCSDLTSVTIPNSVTNIGDGAFAYCTKLAGIAVVALNAYFSSVDGVLFNKSTNTLVQCPGGKSGSYMIPNSVTNIGNYAFSGDSGLTSVTIPNSVTNIGDSAFSWCTSLTDVIIPNSVTGIGSYAFYHISGLTNVMIGNSVTGIGSYAFQSCSGLTSVIIPNSITSIGEGAFASCSGLTSVTIPNSVTSIGSYAFYNCSGLKTVCFLGSAPGAGTDSTVFSSSPATIYYLAGTSGWHTPFDGRPAFLWNPKPQTSGIMFGVRTNRFGFNITGSSNLVIVVEGCTNLVNPVWLPVSTNTLNTFIGTNGTSYFSDSQWTNYPGRFYRLRSP